MGPTVPTRGPDVLVRAAVVGRRIYGDLGEEAADLGDPPSAGVVVVDVGSGHGAGREPEVAEQQLHGVPLVRLGVACSVNLFPPCFATPPKR
jgi:hypothetical protein